MDFDALAAARQIAAAHAAGAHYANLSGAFAPPTIADAYRVQEALVPLWSLVRGPVNGLKIATTTKVMQRLMGIDHPCAGMIYAGTIHRGPAEIATAEFVHPMIECELAVRIGADLSPRGAPYSRDTVRSAIATVMPAFELIDDRFADYSACHVTTLIADNAWNGGVVIGDERELPPAFDLDGLIGTLTIDGGQPIARAPLSGRTDDPLGALVWLANLAAERGRPLTRDMVVITGSVIATLPLEIGTRLQFEIAGLGTVALTAV